MGNPDDDVPGDAGQGQPSPPTRPTRARQALAAVGVALVVAALAVGIVRAGSDGGDDGAAPEDRSSASSTGETAAEDADAATEDSPAGPAGSTTTSPSAAADEAATAAGTATTLPGVVDQGDPRAVTRALLDLAAAGVAPAEAARHLQGGDSRIATELFMYTAEGIASAPVGECPPTTGATVVCRAAIETSYGGHATADVTLARGTDPAVWLVSDVELATG